MFFALQGEKHQHKDGGYCSAEGKNDFRDATA
jgi:hypothetical protein